MTEPRRLLSVSPNPLTRALLAAGREEAPSSEARLGAAIAIGIAGGLATTAVAGGASAATGMASGAGGGTGTAIASKWLGTMGVLKLVGTTIVSGALVVGAVHEHRQLAARAASSRVRTVASVAPRPSVATKGSARSAIAAPSSPPPPPMEAAPPIELATSAPSSTPLPATLRAEPTAAPATPPVPARAKEARPSAAQPTLDQASLRDEVERLDGARSALAGGQVVAVLAQVEAYDRAFPRGALAEEAELLRIEAMIQAGQPSAALVRVERLLARDGYGPHARRLRALLASLRSNESAR